MSSPGPMSRPPRRLLQPAILSTKNRSETSTPPAVVGIVGTSTVEREETGQERGVLGPMPRMLQLGGALRVHALDIDPAVPVRRPGGRRADVDAHEMRARLLVSSICPNWEP